MTASRFSDWTEASLADAACTAMESGRRLGADAVSASAQAGGGMRFVARDGAVETRLRDAAQSLTVTLYRDGRSGNASTTALDPASVEQAVAAAAAIADHVRADPDSAPADPDWLAIAGPLPPLFEASAQGPEALMATTRDIEAAVARAAAARGADVRVSEAGVATSETMSALAISTGFCRSGAATHHARWAMVLARGADGSAQDYAESQDRRPGLLDPPDALAALAVERAAQQLGARAMAGGRMPVLFAPRAAAAIVHDLVGALGGGPQERESGFLTGALGRQVAASHLDLTEDPFEPYGLVSSGYDSEGVAGSTRAIVAAGVARGYFLGCRSARRLGMRPTGNADGAHNLRLASRATPGGLPALLARLGDGLFVTQLLGGTTDPASGNWTRAVRGFRIAGGAIGHPVSDMTVGGHLPDMLRAVDAVGADEERLGLIRTGSVLIDGLMVGGAA